MARSNAKRINLALQGGGAHGAVTWGVIDRLLQDERLEFDSISGTSAGAVNAISLAYGLHLDGRDGARKKLEEVWRAVADAGSLYNPIPRMPWGLTNNLAEIGNSVSQLMFDTFTRALSPYQFNPFDINPLKDILKRCINFDELRECKRAKLYISATNVRSGKVHVFRTADVSIDAVLASACLPFLFQAVEVDGEHYWDGGYMGNPVLFPFFYESESQDIVIVHVNPLTREKLPETASDIMDRVNEISFNAALLGELRAIGFVHKLLGHGWLKDEYRDRLKNIRIHSIRSDEALQEMSASSKFNVDWRFLTDLKERGAKIAEAWIAANYDALGNNSSVNIRELYDGNE